MGKKIAIVGAGWYGCHLARVLKLAGFEVTLLEKHADIFKGISGKFGIRCHSGLHYPRSQAMRVNCQERYAEFIKTYPDLVLEHTYSIYGLGNLDADNEQSKTDFTTFKKVGKEANNSREIDPKQWGYNNLQCAFNVEESSILIDNILREKFRQKLLNANVKIVCNFTVNKLIKSENNKIIVIGEGATPEIFDHVINATSYQTLLPLEQSLPFDINIFYQPCLALVYEDRLSKVMSLPPFSFIVMDGWFPCIMPYISHSEALDAPYRKYIVTHSKYTIMGSYKSLEEANACLANINDKVINELIKPKCESEMEKFWPQFAASMHSSMERRFKYIGWKSSILAKIKTNREFRGAVTFAKDNIIHIIPGKITNIFDVEREVISLINNQNILYQGDYQYVKNGILDCAIGEITEPLDRSIRNTCTLQTYSEITKTSFTERIK